MRRGPLALVFVAILAGIAGAQPSEPAPPPEPDAPPSEPAAPPPPSPTAGRTQFDAAFDAMVRGDFAAAAAGFRTVAGSDADPELRGAATEMARLADELLGRGAHLSFGAGPGAAPAPDVVAVSEDDEPTGGRASFVTTTTMASLYSGVVLIDLLDVGDVRAGTALVMGTTAAGVVGSLYGTRGRTMTGGMADAWSLGMFAGAGNALLLAGPFGLYRSSSNASEKVQTFVLASTWGAATAGLLVADRIRPTRAQVGVMETFGLMGVASTLLSLAVAQPDSLSDDAFLTITAVGLDAGLGIGAGFASKLDWSTSRARLVSLSAFLGAVAGGGTSILLFANNGNSDSGRLAAGITLAGLWGGFGLGMHLTRNMAPDYRFRQHATTQLAPTLIHDAPGLALIGAF